MPSQTEKRNSKRERIMRAAAKLFFERGYIGTTMSAICDELAVTKPFVYYYFKDKPALLEAVSFEAAEVTMTSLRRGAEGRSTAADRLEGGLREFLTSHVDRFEAGSLYLREAAYFSASAQRRMRKLSRRFRDDLVELLGDAVSDGVLPPQNIGLTASAIGGIAGFMYTWYRPRGPLKPDEVVEELLVRALRTAGQGLSGGVTPAPEAPKATRRRAPRSQSADAS